MRSEVQWIDWEGKGLERCVCTLDKDGLVLEGVVIGTREGRYGGYYRVVTDDAFRTREVHVKYIGGPSLHIEADAEGRWYDRIGQRKLPFLDGCFDVDIGITPATNMLPVKRLKLSEQDGRDISAAYVPLPGQLPGLEDSDFLPKMVAQRYTCLTLGTRYRYEGLFRGFEAELAFDDNGLVLDYPDTFRRVL